jgi:hypothetical protein
VPKYYVAMVNDMVLCFEIRYVTFLFANIKYLFRMQTAHDGSLPNAKPFISFKIFSFHDDIAKKIAG